jgi:hypothetical protein
MRDHCEAASVSVDDVRLHDFVLTGIACLIAARGVPDELRTRRSSTDVPVLTNLDTLRALARILAGS